MRNLFLLPILVLAVAVIVLAGIAVLGDRDLEVRSRAVSVTLVEREGG